MTSTVKEPSTFKELCLDSARPDETVGRFWAALTGCDFEIDPSNAPGDVVGEQEGMGIAICPVPEAKTVKNRVHLDVSVGSLDEVTALGGTLGESHDHWTICHDPEGNEFCAFVRDGELPAYRTFEIVVDSVDHQAIAGWWADRFGVEAQSDDRPFAWLTGVPGFPTAGPFFAMVFGTVPEAKTVKNRMHWDVYGDVAEFEAAGATRLWEAEHWVTLADPEGNEFCVFEPRHT